MMEQVRLCAVWPTAGDLACLFHEPHTGFDHCLRMLQVCFRKRMSAPLLGIRALQDLRVVPGVLSGAQPAELEGV